MYEEKKVQCGNVDKVNLTLSVTGITKFLPLLYLVTIGFDRAIRSLNI